METITSKIEDIKQISLEGRILHDDWSLTTLCVSIEECINTAILDERDDEDYGKTIVFDIMGYDEDHSNKTNVGFIQGRFFDLAKMDKDGYPPEILLDNIDQYTWNFYETILQDFEKYVGIFFNMFIIDKIYIDEPYRNNKIGTVSMLLLNRAIEDQFGADVGVLLLEPKVLGPENKQLKDEEIDLLYQKTVNFFEKLDFRFTINDNIMYFNTDNDMRKLYNLKNN